MKTFEELKAELLQNPEVRAEYERLRTKEQKMALSCDDMTLNCFRLKCAVYGKYFNTPEEFAAAAMAEESLVERILAALATLTPKESKVLQMRFGINYPNRMKLKEIGPQFDVSGERIRQIEAKALRKLRNPRRKSIWEKSLTENENE